MKRYLFLLVCFASTPAQADPNCYDTLSKALEEGLVIKDPASLIDFDGEMIHICNKRDNLLLEAMRNRKEIEKEINSPSVITETASIPNDDTFFDGIISEPRDISINEVGPVSLYSVVTTFGTSQRLQAIITDGSQTWTVKPGSRLPGNISITDIKPHEVIIKDNTGKHTLGWKSPSSSDDASVEQLLSGSN